MMVVMKKDHTKEELQEVLDHLKENGLGAHMSVGVERTVIGVLGHIYPELAEEIEAFPGLRRPSPSPGPTSSPAAS